MADEHSLPTVGAKSQGTRRIALIGRVAIVDDAPPFEPREAEAILNWLFNGIAWEDALADRERRIEIGKATK